ncbi:MAG: hypothetical protein ACLPX7_07790 [Xanthobacteraceae bacterium]
MFDDRDQLVAVAVEKAAFGFDQPRAVAGLMKFDDRARLDSPADRNEVVSADTEKPVVRADQQGAVAIGMKPRPRPVCDPNKFIAMQAEQPVVTKGDDRAVIFLDGAFPSQSLPFAKFDQLVAVTAEEAALRGNQHPMIVGLNNIGSGAYFFAGIGLPRNKFGTGEANETVESAKKISVGETMDPIDLIEFLILDEPAGA